MMRKTYGSLPKLVVLPGGARPRCRVRCSLAMESNTLKVEPGLLSSVLDSAALAASAARIYRESLEGTPRFARALQDYSAQHLVETIVEGLLQLTSNEIEGFSICPLVTESIRCLTLDRAPAEVEVIFCAAIFTYYTEQESAVAKAHDGHLELYRAYYQDVLVKFVNRRMGELLDPAKTSRLEEVEAHAAETLGAVLTELRNRFPLEPFQARYESTPATPDGKAAVVRKLCQAMRVQAKQRLGI